MRYLEPIAAAKSGVFWLNGSARLEDIEQNARQHGLQMSVISAHQADSKAALMNTFKHQLRFPDYFRPNWDALLDMLRDLSWLPGKGHVIAVEGLEQFAAADQEAHKTLLATLNDAADFWSAQSDRPLIIYLSNRQLTQLRPQQIKIAPSILSADFTRLGEQVREAEAAGAELLHVDVMDGRFVPNITFGPLIVEALRRVTQMPLDVHLMIVEPELYIDRFAKAGATMIDVHVETCPHLHRTIQQIKGLGVKAGVAINPHTPYEMVRDLIPELDRVLIMTVNPGFGGQKLIPSTLAKIAQFRDAAQKFGVEIEIGVDGGVDESTVRSVVSHGANVLVAGNSVFAAKDGIAEGILRLRAAASG